MRWRYFIILQTLIILFVSGVVYLHQDKSNLVKTPPTVLAKWYKPENKRQVWLHNMFKLRREMQAVEFYAKNKEDQLLQKWVKQLGEHYYKISEMVPSWQKKLAVDTIEALKVASENKHYSVVLTQHKALQQSCNTCHDDYQAITALTYRAPDFSKVSISDEVSYVDHMSTLTTQVNQIKISAQDDNTALALSSLAGLSRGMHTLGETCVDCHKKDRKPYPDKAMKTTLASLEKSLITGSIKEQGRALGTLAVLACARCHGTHRLAYGVKKQLSSEVSFSQLMRH